LVELDEYDFFRDCLTDQWDSVFHKRPRSASLDGCGIFWRRSKFDSIASCSIDFMDAIDSKGRETRDRCCVMVLLRWRASGSPLVVVSTHLAKDPDNRAQTAIRVRQVSQLVEGLSSFTESEGVCDAPVILLGDLNAKHFGEIRGIALTVWQIKGAPIHNFLWHATDVRTGPTSITKARRCRIDCVQYVSSQLEVLDVAHVPSLSRDQVIPNAEHPSDHFPVYARFKLKNSYQKHKEYARSWLECVAGQQRLHPLTDSELTAAFEFFDRNCSSSIHRRDLEDACLDLGCNLQCDVQRLLLSCFPDSQISFRNFIKAYEVQLNHSRLRCIGDLESAFQFIADSANHISREKLKTAFREITPVTFTDDEINGMIERVNPDNKPLVDIHSFCEVVSRSTFTTRDTPSARSSTKSSSGPGSRMCTKELAYRLNSIQSDSRLGVNMASVSSPLSSQIRRSAHLPSRHHTLLEVPRPPGYLF